MKNGNNCSIIVSGMFLCTGHPTGTHRSSYNLIRGLINLGIELIVACPSEPNRIWDLDDEFRGKVKVCGAWVKNFHIWEQFYLPLFFRTSRLLYTMGSGPFVFGCSRSAMVLHDINYKITTSAYTFSFKLAYHFVSYFAAKRCSVILCVSDYTRKRFIERSGVEKSKCFVFHQGSGSLVSTKIVDVDVDVETVDPFCGDPYFLCVGSLQPHKNFKNIVKAFDLVRAQNVAFREYKLLVVGKPQSGFRSVNVDFQDSGVVFLGYVNDSDLLKLYSKAQCFVFPSLEEGFGMPIIEAFSQNCPVVTSNVSCMPEISGNAALLVDPCSSSEIADAMIKCVDSATRKKMIEAGNTRLILYNWTNASMEVVGFLVRSGFLNEQDSASAGGFNQLE